MHKLYHNRIYTHRLSPIEVLRINFFIKFVVITLMQDNIATGISFKKGLISKIDYDRGDIPRSKFIQRILERYYSVQEPQKEKNKKTDSSDSTTAAKQKEESDESTIT